MNPLLKRIPTVLWLVIWTALFPSPAEAQDTTPPVVVSATPFCANLLWVVVTFNEPVTDAALDPFNYLIVADRSPGAPFLQAMTVSPQAGDGTVFNVMFPAGPFTPSTASVLHVASITDLAGNFIDFNGPFVVPLQPCLVPEPAPLGLAALIFAGWAFLRRRR